MFKFIHPPRNRSEAWRCAMINQLACPGLGTIIAGQKIGFAQAGVMLVGFFLFTGYLCWFIFHQLNLLFDMGAGGQQFDQTRFEHWWIGAVGLGLCLIAWIWSLASSIELVRRSPENAPPAHLPPRIY
ncbi:MAG: hypothetical protein ABIQ35_02490 [Verrucomicrobiota bacterium]